MTPSLLPIADFERFGYALLPGAFRANETQSLSRALAAALEADRPAVLRSRGQTYGSRDLIDLFPQTCEIPRQPVLRDFIAEVLGSRAGLVRALFFDKPPDRRWSLPWHRDRTVAVKNNDQTFDLFPTPHAQSRHSAHRSPRVVHGADAHSAITP